MNQDTDISVDQVLAHAAWNDSVLQSYRGLFLTTQAILIASGTGLFGIAILADRVFQAVLASGLLSMLAVMSFYFTWEVRALMMERRQRVNFSIDWLLRTEKSWPPDSRHMSIFKFVQDQGRSLDDYWSQDAREELLQDFARETEKENGAQAFHRPIPPYTLFATDAIYVGILIIWVSLLASSWVYTFVAAGESAVGSSTDAPVLCIAQTFERVVMSCLL